MDETPIALILRILNEAVKADARAVTLLIEQRVPCNAALAEHPSIAIVSGAPGDPAYVGVLGLLNGICEPLTGNRIVANVGIDGVVTDFRAWYGNAKAGAPAKPPADDSGA